MTKISNKNFKNAICCIKYKTTIKYIVMLRLLSIFILATLMACNNSNTKESLSASLMINHLGYLKDNPKKLVLQTTTDFTPDNFIIANESGETVFESKFEKGGKVDNWHTGNAYAGDFTTFNETGKYYIIAQLNGQEVKSELFEIKEGNFALDYIPLLIEGFQHERCAGEFDEKDKQSTFFGSREDIVDVHGGWYDASGEKGKYLSHLCFSNYMTPQQTPIVVWNMLEALDILSPDLKDNVMAKNLFDEALFGADFLMRMQDKEGYFYTNVFANWSSDPTKREICAYEGIVGKKTEDYKAALREGAGVTIAALARISQKEIAGDYTSVDYLNAAQKGFDHLLENNLEYADDGKENIIDVYCGLLAATEIYMASKNEKYQEHAKTFLNKLLDYQKSDENFENWWSATEDGSRPFFHGAEAGLPLIVLHRYLQIEENEETRAKVIDAIKKSVNHEIAITNEVLNPYGYARQYIKPVDENKKSSFFLPHKNETGYWWQGENARLASLASAFQIVMPLLDDEQKAKAQTYATDQINWILGMNPYDAGMLAGAGRNNPDYNVNGKSYNFKGGVSNGITAGFEDESDIGFMPLPQNNDPGENWRWSEQWIPHGAWLILALASSN